MGISDQYASVQGLIARVSDEEFRLMRISENINWADKTCSEELAELAQQKESELQSIQLDPNDDNITLEEYTAAIQEQQQVLTKYSRLENKVLSDAKSITDPLEQQKTMVETSLAHDRADLEGLKESLNNDIKNGFGYFQN